MTGSLFHRFLPAALGGFLAASAPAALPVFAAGEDGAFYRQLAGMVNSQDTSGYFDSMRLSLGSNILPSDEQYHGAHVAGTVIDCCGDANVQILPVRVMDGMGFGGVSQIAAGIKYAADQGADVINLSLGRYRFGNNVEDEAIRYAVEKGSFVVIAAGNNNEDTETFCPAHMTVPGVAVVSAGNPSRNKIPSSNYGNSVDIMAPGYAVEGFNCL